MLPIVGEVIRLFCWDAPWLRHGLSHTVKHRARHDGSTGVDVSPNDRKIIAVITEDLIPVPVHARRIASV